MVSGESPGLKRAEPTPKPLAPADQYAAMFSSVTPPTGISSVPFGRIAFHALMMFGGICSPGKAFSALAPCRSAARASVGVATPGKLTRPIARVLRITCSSMLGLTTSMPPASATKATSSSVSTVPAPTTTLCGRPSARILMLSSARGEFRGTSTMVIPASTSAFPVANASCDSSPRRMATTGHARSARSQRSSAFSSPRATEVSAAAWGWGWVTARG
mmetsp:Transcript_141670/g.394968  ORF Transcript_141670/g.394968 Transcript_141670/m.394968 type:complete len:218 (+) Transcript_141670:117-770(+)